MRAVGVDAVVADAEDVVKLGPGSPTETLPVSTMFTTATTKTDVHLQ